MDDTDRMTRRKTLDHAFEKVVVTGGFLRTMIDRNNKSTLPHVFLKCVEEGDVSNLEIACGRRHGEYCGVADRDSNLFKMLEGACYCLALEKDDALAERVSSLVELIAACQQPDGYLQSYISSQKPEERYRDLHRSHELYSMGHLLEAAVAHYEVTGERTLLDVAIRVADHLDEAFGPGKREMPPGHQEIELALVRLFHVTGEQRYLALSKFFVDMRGDKQMVAREYGGKPIIENDRTPGRNRPPFYRQDHLPVVEQREATGHAVRAGYLYAAMADLAMALDSEPLADACEAIWNNITSKKMYLSGGVGTHQYHDEGFGDNYLLPNTGYCETCGGIALLLFSQRMALMTGKSKYADIVELVLYNHILSSMDLSGCLTFYRNPLSAREPRQRPPWNNPACCPTNIVRIIPQLVRYLYTVSDRAVYVEHFACSKAEFVLQREKITIMQETDYPWGGDVHVRVMPASPSDFTLHIRIPGWVRGRPAASDLYLSEDRSADVQIAINGQPVDVITDGNGYLVLDRVWHPQDQVAVHFPMTVQRVTAHPAVETDRGRVAFMRGPILYCFEEVDTGMDPEDVVIPEETIFQAEHRADQLGGVTVLLSDDHSLTAIPFFVWNNRQPGKMAVWMQASVGLRPTGC
jgi:DUF1680 family protein